MPSKKCFRASAKARKSGPTWLEAVRKGEIAAQAGQPRTSNPYRDTDTEAADDWDWGYDGIIAERPFTRTQALLQKD